jgi:hypothetical protein
MKLMHYHRWASTSISMSAISDIRYRHLLFRYRRQICRTEKTSFRYRKCSDINIRVHSDIQHWRKKNIPLCSFETAPPGMISERFNTKLLWLPGLTKISKMSDIGYKIIPISYIMLDSALSVRYQKFWYQAQSDIADHGYRTKCPPKCTTHSFDI